MADVTQEQFTQALGLATDEQLQEVLRVRERARRQALHLEAVRRAELFRGQSELEYARKFRKLIGHELLTDEQAEQLWREVKDLATSQRDEWEAEGQSWG